MDQFESLSGLMLKGTAKFIWVVVIALTIVCLGFLLAYLIGSSGSLGIALGILLAIVIGAGVIYLYFWFLRSSFASRYRRNFERTCRELGKVEYRKKVHLPNDPGEYSLELATALFDISRNTTSANCREVLPLTNPPGFEEHLRLVGCDHSNTELSMYGYIFWSRSREQACIAFTSTSTVGEWLDNFNYPLRKADRLNGWVPGVKCHRGFYRIYSEIQDQLWDWYQQNKSWLRTLYITGHSLGGALSTLAAYDFAGAVPCLVHYSFGAPRVGNLDFALWFNHRVPYSMRVNNTEDPVPQLPPATWDQNTYQHTEHNIAFTVSLGSLARDHVEAYYCHLPS